MSYLMKDLPEAEKPREKAKQYGIENLTDAELLAILLHTGTRDLSVKDLSLKILEKVEEVEGFTNLRLPALLEIKGIGEAKAITILAMVELAKRMNEGGVKKRLQIKETKDVFENYKNYFIGESQEKFLVLFLNTKNFVMNEKILFTGTANQSMVHPRDIFHEAILNNAVKILCIHNHPTGDESPSLNDKSITKRLQECGELVGIPLLDHVIIGKNSYYSFIENANKKQGNS